MVAIEMQNNSYVHALDSGLFTLGAPHKGKTMYQRIQNLSRMDIWLNCCNIQILSHYFSFNNETFQFVHKTTVCSFVSLFCFTQDLMMFV